MKKIKMKKIKMKKIKMKKIKKKYFTDFIMERQKMPM